MTSFSSSGSPLEVVCLCALWCGSCRSYQPLFEALEASFQGAARFSWVDIEDQSDALGDIDVKNFPTLLILRGMDVLFFGPVLPHASTLSQLVQSVLDGRLQALKDSGLPSLAARIHLLLNEQRIQ